MRILHYGLGFPPYRTGGMTKYCVDLMISHREAGHEVGLLWPGQITFFNRQKIRIKQRKSYKGLNSYEIINPLPIPYDEGIKEIDIFMSDGEGTVYNHFFQNYMPDVLIVHTLMGMHKSLLDAAKENHIKIYYISHDYFGVCPRVTLFHNGEPCVNNSDCSKCFSCNQNALSLSKMLLLQLPLYRALKESALIKKLRRIHRSKVGEASEVVKETMQYNDVEAARYFMLRKHYIEMLKCVDKILYNSQVAKEQYEQFFVPKNSQIIHITHRNLVDLRQKRQFGKTLKILYLAPLKKFKGFDLLIDAAGKLYDSGRKDFTLTVYGECKQTAEYLQVKDKYTYEQLADIFKGADVLVAPSLWNETYGFTVAEAIYSGVPVIVSERVGAKDLVKDDWNGYIISPDCESLYQALLRIYDDRELLDRFHSNILSMDLPKDELIKLESVMAVEEDNNNGLYR